MRLLPLLLILAACNGDTPGKESPPVKESNTTDDSGQDSQTPTETSCNDEVDNDGDTLYDCEDPDCARDSACVGSENCTDGRDNDVDGDTDCADSDCASDPACVTSEICDNSIDDDGDGQTDCQDGDCATDPACAGTEICDNGMDDDGNGRVDCADRQCATDPACVVEICDNGVDDNNDGLIDCVDPDCSTDTACAVEVCDDSMDNDGDGQVDCDDRDCAAELTCQPEVCDNGVDDNADGRSDCDDPDCVNDATCFVCYETDLGSAYGTAVASGNTSGMGSQRDPSCVGNAGVEDVVYQWVAPATGIWTFSTDGSDYDTVLTLEVSGCGTESQCNDDFSGTTSSIEQSLNAGDTVFINVDGYSTTGNYVLNIDLLAESDCGDGNDNDSDGDADCADSDCASYFSCLPESVCDDGLDSDQDALTDCSDPDCSGDIVCGAGSCTDSHLGRVLGSNVVSGNSIGAGDDRQASCGSGGEENVYSWTAPVDGTFSFITDNGHSIQLEEGDCLGTALDCADTGVLSYTLSEGQTVVLVIDNNTSADGAFSLSIYADHETDCADGVDNDGDEALDCDDSDCPSALLDWYPDSDGDHFGEDRGMITTCVAPTGYIYDGGDCDDRDAQIHPYRWEDSSNGVDDDCDGLADSADTDVPTEFFFGDDEADEYVFSNFSYDFCGSNYSSVFVSSNGLLGLDADNTSYSESAASFISPRSAPYAMIAGVWDDLYPNGMPISVIEYSDAVGVYYNNIEDLSSGNINTFAIILRQDGRILMEYDSVLLNSGLSGWSCGNGTGTSADLSVENSRLSYALGVGTGTEEAYYEDFSVNDNNDLSGLSIPYCVQSGTDDDGDGQTGACGDMDDSLLP